MKKALLICLLAACLLYQSAYAYSDIKIEIDSVSRKMSVSGKSEGLLKNEPVKLIVLKPDTNEITADSIIAVNEKYTLNKSDFSFEEYIPEDCEGGKYIFIISSPSGGIYKDTAIYINESTLIKLLNELDVCDGSAAARWLEDNYIYFAIDKLKEFETYEGFSDESKQFVGKIMSQYDFAPESDGSNVSEKYDLVRNIFSDAVFLAAANAVNETNIEEIVAFMEKYRSNFELDENVQGYIDSMTEKQREETLEKLFDGDFESIEGIKTKYRDAILLEKLNTATHWSETASLFETNSSAFNTDSEKREAAGSSKLYIAYASLIGKSFDSIDEAVNAFNKACDKIIADNKTSTPGGSSGGKRTGGGKGAGVVIYEPVKAPEPVSEDKNEKQDVFIDLSEVEWARVYIEELARQKVVSGYGNGLFGPADNVSRGQFAKILVCGFGLIADEAKEIPFVDVDNNNIYKKYIKTSYNMDIFLGVTDNRFDVDSGISREDVCTVIYRAFNKMGYRYEERKESFDDWNDISEYAKDAVSHLAGLGIIDGDGVRFYPKNKITRAEMSKIIYESIEKITEKEVV